MDTVGSSGDRLRGSTDPAAAGGEVAWDPLGGRLATTNEGTLHMWASNDLSRPTSSHPVAKVPLLRLAWSRDGQRLAASCADGHLRCWDVRDAPTLILDAQVAFNWLTDVAFDPSGMELAGVDGQGTLQVWDVAGGRLLRKTETQARFRSVAWSPDGNHLATGDESSIPRLWSADLVEQAHVPLDLGYIWDVTWHPFDGSVACATSSGQLVVLPEVDPSSPVLVETSEQALWRVAWAPKGDVLATTGDDGSLRIGDPRSPFRPWTTFRVSTGTVLAASWNPDGRSIATAGDDGVVRIWDAAGA